MVSLDLLVVLGVIAAVLLLQPLVFLVYAYVVYRTAAKFTRKQAEKAVDGRIDRVAAHAREITGGDSS